VFDGGAGSYDRIERMMALGSGSWYRREALEVAGLRSGMRVLDVATGTGWSPARAVALTGDARLVTGVDPSAGMIAQARQALDREGTPLRLIRGRAEQLPLPADAFDFLSMGYALRHVADLPTTFGEFLRVLRPGGTVCVLELTSPEGPIRRTLLRAYMKGLIPCLSRIATPERENRAGTTLLWRYYWETIEACVDPATVMAAMRQAGFTDVARRVRLGIFSDYVGRKPDK
jgi:demethylmenaquinone methyltransferase/2-methoxy-6-polyprenyl-1,4-benzoquinol methylase